MIVLFALSLLAFGLVHLLPGSPVDTLAGPYSDAATRARLTTDLGLDKPLPVQYVTWLANTLSGDFGTSVFNGLPVRELIGDRLPNTLQLAVFATLTSIAWGIPAGALSAMKRGRLFDATARATTFVGLAIPVFAFGVALVLLFSIAFPSWPTLGFVPFSQDPAQNLQSMVLPSIALGLPLGSTLCRFMRSSMLEVYEQDFIRTALATGSTHLQATMRHGLRNAAAPVATVAGLQMAGIVGNSILIENVFAIPGIGQLTVTAITQHDVAVAQACILVLGATYVVLNFAVDLLLPLIDPQIGAK
ncbi:ABC transporter permease [Micromonospora endophytica]|uniref:ABC transporter permease n=1 Tax=Micromonospora endophytica TaxID=515350 RepID=A0A2W2CF35_9ACTN|nr:ABC transporter permease [Micromonospora endophytica]RIW49837.1 ABC transporter permease [Micromonospora endophytica]